MKNETLYTIGTKEDREDIIDFINYVFSQAYVPHDFKKIFPGIYGDHIEELQAVHFLAKQKGRIRALVAGRTKAWHVLGKTLKVGTIGNVAVHPYSRGEGHMKELMANAMEAARNQGCDLLILSGKRQRYNYFGFEQAGWVYRYRISQTSVRHSLGDVDASDVAFTSLKEEMIEDITYAWALQEAQQVYVERPREEFLDTMHEIEHDLQLITVDGKRAGYIMGHGVELVLENEEVLPKVLKAFLKQDSVYSVTLSVPPWHLERMAILSPIYDRRSIEAPLMIHVCSWKNTIEALLKLKASFVSLDDGKLTLSMDGETITIHVEKGEVTVTDGESKADMVYEHLQAQRTLFGLEGLSESRFGLNWFPLPLHFCPPDEF